MAKIHEIRPYWDRGIPFSGGIKTTGLWVFDDKARKIKHEPFVGNTNVIIDNMVLRIPNAVFGFRLQFSDEQFEGCNLFPLTRMEDDKRHKGCWYMTRLSDGSRAEGWLCKVLYKYFDKTPDTIWYKASPL